MTKRSPEHQLYNLLLIDENLSNYASWSALMTQMQLGQAQYVLHWCKSITSASQRMLAKPIDMVLLNCSQNSKDAQAFLAEHPADANIPVIAIDEKGDNDQREQMMAAGAVECVDGYQNPTMVERVFQYVFDTCKTISDQFVPQPSTNATHHVDVLTGLYNREWFAHSIQALVDSRPQDFAVLHIDFDNFKRVNYQYGHAVGDELLKLIAQQLQYCLSQHGKGFIARLTNDEFGIVLENTKSHQYIEQSVQRVLEQWNQVVMTPSHDVMLTVSVGVATYPQDGTNSQDLLKHALLAKAQAKQMPGSHYSFYHSTVKAEFIPDCKIADLRRGLAYKEFCVYYQPRVHLETAQVMGVEALVRWDHPEKGIISPDTFIPLAEENNLIQSLGYQVIEAVCEDINTLDLLGLQLPEISINVSFLQFKDKNFISQVKSIFQRANVSPQRIEFELTESAAVTDIQLARYVMEQMQAAGFRFSLDDFGTGYSSITHLQQLPVKSLKIDRSFITDVPDSYENASIVRSLVDLGHSLGMDVIAEGAEDKRHVDFLKQINCDQVQGFYYCCPVNLTDLMCKVDKTMRLHDYEMA